MAYQITAETPTEITLTPVAPPVGCVRWVMAGLGLVALLIGSGLLLLRWQRGADALNLTAGVFVAFGLLFLGLGLTMKPTKGPGPAAFVFDQRRGGIWLYGPAAGAPPAAATSAAAFDPAQHPVEAFLPFADLAGLRVAERAHTSSSSRSSSGRTTYTYHVALDLADGGTWTLTSTSDPAAAEALRARLFALVARADQAAAPAPPPPVLPAALALARPGNLVQLRWRNHVAPAEVLRTLAGMGFVAGVLAVFGFIMRAENDLPVFAYAVQAFIGGVFLWIAGAQGWRWWRDSRRRYGLDLGPAAVAYLEEDLATGREALRRELPLAEYYGLSTDFEASSTDYDPTVRLLSHAAHAQLLHRKALVLAPALVETMREAVAKNLAWPLHLKALGPGPRLALVQWARAEVGRLRASR